MTLTFEERLLLTEALEALKEIYLDSDIPYHQQKVRKIEELLCKIKGIVYIDFQKL